jgi:hypothetical protein
VQDLAQEQLRALVLEIAGLYVAAADPALSYSTGQIFGATGGGGQPA